MRTYIKPQMVKRNIELNVLWSVSNEQTYDSAAKRLNTSFDDSYDEIDNDEK